MTEDNNPIPEDWDHTEDAEAIEGLKRILHDDKEHIYVNAAIGHDAFTGCVPEAPMATLQAAIDALPAVVDHPIVIHLAGGDYQNFDPAGKVFKHRLAIVGDDPNSTIVRCAGNKPMSIDDSTVFTLQTKR